MLPNIQSSQLISHFPSTCNIQFVNTMHYVFYNSFSIWRVIPFSIVHRIEKHKQKCKKRTSYYRAYYLHQATRSSDTIFFLSRIKYGVPYICIDFLHSYAGQTYKVRKLNGSWCTQISLKRFLRLWIQNVPSRYKQIMDIFSVLFIVYLPVLFLWGVIICRT